jgi:hypothetical protein
MYWYRLKIKWDYKKKYIGLAECKRRSESVPENQRFIFLPLSVFRHEIMLVFNKS